MTSQPREQSIPQLDALTGIRGVAAWFVVFYHIRLSMVELLPAGVIAALAKGYLAVDLFFMLSGFVMWLNYGERFRREGLALAPRFWWKRFARIWPLHVALLAGLAGFALALLATGRDAGNYPFAELPLHILLVQNWGFTDALSWNHPAWSISTELAAYLLFPFLVIAVPWEKLRLVALSAGAVMLCALLFLAFFLQGHEALGDAIASMGLLRCLVEFALGVLACRLWEALRNRRSTAFLLFVCGAALLVGGIGAGWPETVFVPAAFLILLLALALDTGPVARLLASQPLRALGDASYSTYLVHFPLFIVFKLAFVDDSLQLGWAGVAGFMALLALCSALLYRFWEKPAQRWLNARPPRLIRARGSFSA